MWRTGWYGHRQRPGRRGVRVRAGQPAGLQEEAGRECLRDRRTVFLLTSTILRTLSLWHGLLREPLSATRQPRHLLEPPAFCDNVRKMSHPPYRIGAQALLVGLFAVCVYRAITQSIVYDEALTWELYISGPVSNIFHLYDANHHFLNTVLVRLSTALLGVSEWSMRLPALAGAALYFTACYRLARTAFGDGFSMLLAVTLATLNPFVLDFMVAARGYGLALALWMYAAALLLDAFSRQAYSKREMLVAGVTLALSVTANLVFVLPAAALAGTALYFIRQRSATLAAPDVPKKNLAPPSCARDARKKNKAAAPRQPRNSGFPPWLAFALPIAAIALLFLNLAPFENMRAKHFYTGAATIAESLRSLASSSLEHSGPLRTRPWVHQWTNL